MQNLQTRFANIRVLVVGDFILDHYQVGQAHRLSPEAPVPGIDLKDEYFRLGGAANVAKNCASLGASVQFLSLMGQDADHTQAQVMLNDAGIQSTIHSPAGFSTIRKTRVISQHQQLLRIDQENQPQTWNTQALFNQYELALKNADVVILSDYAKGVLQDPQAWIQAAKAQNIPVFVDPKQHSFAPYAGATCITPNQKELQAMLKGNHKGIPLEQAAQATALSHDIDYILLTKGAEGMTLIQPNAENLHFCSTRHDVFDVTGAGDTVIATMALSYACQFSLDDCLKVASFAAGLVVTQLGTATPPIDQLQNALYATEPAEKRKILTKEQAQIFIEQAKSRSETCVLTNGCFDLLHPGHLHYLREAKALGTYLIVAVNDDASITRLKGAPRPIYPLQMRLTMLASLEMIDALVVFSEDTPEGLIAQLLPNILVKGGDYKGKTVAGAKEVIASGGRLELLSFLDGHSTTHLLEHIAKTHAK